MKTRRELEEEVADLIRKNVSLAKLAAGLGFDPNSHEKKRLENELHGRILQNPVIIVMGLIDRINELDKKIIRTPQEYASYHGDMRRDSR